MRTSDEASEQVQESYRVPMLSSTRCPSGHRLALARAPAGSCDGCGHVVAEDQVVWDCRQCNWYLCAHCEPIAHCPKQHDLHTSQAVVGTCDGCGKRVKKGQVVSNCSECNWYVCARCRPAWQCPSKHKLQTIAAVAGTCDGCHRHVRQGAAVSDCRTCNWYLCGACRPILRCPQHHDLQTAAAVAGTCDGCRAYVHQGEPVSDCRECNWYLCSRCTPLTKPPKGRCTLCKQPAMPSDKTITSNGHRWQICSSCEESCEAPAAAPDRALFGGTESALSTARVLFGSAAFSSETKPNAGDMILNVMPFPQCSEGHLTLPQRARSGKCGQCGESMGADTVALGCESCDWQLCMGCYPISHCAKGHRLDTESVSVGLCDGCGKRIEAEQSVLACMVCNWYLCGGCQKPPARSARCGA